MEPRVERYRLVLVLLSMGLLLAVLLVARGALFPFVISAIIAYLLLPSVRLIETRVLAFKRWPGARRVAAILFVYLVAALAAVGSLAAIIPEAVRQATEFVDSVPTLFTDARETLEGWNRQYVERVPEGVRDQIQEKLESGGDILIQAAQTIVVRTLGTVVNLFTVVLGLAVVPIFVFYLLKDRDATVSGFYALLPAAAKRHVRNVVDIVNRVLGAYIRAQLTLALFVGVIISVGLFALGIPSALLLGIIAGLFELVPVVGPLLGTIPGLLVVLAVSPGDLVWVLLLYVGVQAVQNVFLVPRVQGSAVNIHPAIIMVIIVVASEVAGLWGVIVAVPLAAAARDVFRYFYAEWTTVPPALAAQGSSAEPPPVEPDAPSE
jgi:predicted PurR-regulated permease PerM